MPITALTRVRFGNYRTSPPPNHTSPVAGTLRTSHIGQAAQNIWVSDLGGWIGKGEATAGSTVIALYYVGQFPANSQPSTLLARTDAITLATLYTSNSGGAGVVEDIDTAYLVDGIRYPMIQSGMIYAVGALNTARDLGVGYTEPTAWAGDLNFYNKSGLSSLPDPFVPSSQSVGSGRLTYWVEGYVNTPPEAPSGLGPAGTVTSLTPTFEGNFWDYCGTWGASNGGFDFGDRLTKYQIQVRAVGSTTLLWNGTFSATSGESTADQFTRTYSGSALSRGVPYEQRCRVSDSFSEWSPWSSWQSFDIADAGTALPYGTPIGKQLAVSGYTFQGKWSHASSLSMTHARVRIMAANGTTILQTSPDVAKSVAHSTYPGTAFTVSWAESTFSDLNWATAYKWGLEGKDTNGEWSELYVSEGFTTDYPPSIPSNPRPTGGPVYTAPPLLSVLMNDPDDANASVTPYFNLRPVGLVWENYATGTYNAGTGRFEKQLSTSHLTLNEVQNIVITSTSAPTGGSFTLTFDGQTTGTIAYNAAAGTVQTALEALSNIAPGDIFMYSGAGARNHWVVFTGTYAGTNVPQITINVAGLTGGSGHVGTVTTTVPGGIYYGDWVWDVYGYDGTLYSGGVTSAGLASRSTAASFTYHDGPDVTIDDPDDADTITSSSLVVNWTTTDQQKKRVRLYLTGTSTVWFDSGLLVSTDETYTIPAGSYQNGVTYDLQVYVEDSLATSGSQTITITIDYADADPLLNVQAIQYQVPGDPVPTAILVSWDQTGYPQIDAGAGAFAEYVVQRRPVDDSAWTTLYRTENPEAVVYVDYVPVSGVSYVYRVMQVVTLAGTPLNSTPVDVEESIELGRYTVLASTVAPDTYRCVLTNVTAKSSGRERSETVFRSPNGGASTTIIGVDRDSLLSVEAAVIADTIMTAQDRKISFEELDNTGHSICIRDGKVGDPLKLFGRILDPTVEHRMGDTTGTWYGIAFGVRTEQFTEGL